MRIALVLTVALAACVAQSTPDDQPPPAPAPTPTSVPSPDPGGSDQPGTVGAQGQTCGAKDACEAGTTCVTYYGVAGPNGPQFRTCEIQCKSGAQCPQGQACTTVADGPGRVCRAAPTPTPSARTGKQGETCGDNDACETGTKCVTYYGVAGPQGPEFKSCEIKCATDKQCPQGQACATVADGPGQVCRAAPTPATNVGKQGHKCGANDACESGTKCVKYYGIAGPKGPQFTSCEVRCKTSKQCRQGQTCTTIADGPGQVCR